MTYFNILNDLIYTEYYLDEEKKERMRKKRKDEEEERKREEEERKTQEELDKEMWEYKRDGEKISYYLKEYYEDIINTGVRNEYWRKDDITDSINSSGNFFN